MLSMELFFVDDWIFHFNFNTQSFLIKHIQCLSLIIMISEQFLYFIFTLWCMRTIKNNMKSFNVWEGIVWYPFCTYFIWKRKATFWLKNNLRSRGNDLSTPSRNSQFPGLREGDRWCLCAGRWKEALAAKMAPPVILRATHRATLQHVKFDELRKSALGNTSRRRVQTKT